MEAFRNIGEVSVELGVKKHVLRFWESKFPQLKPMKRGGGRRYYRPSDVQLLRGIRHLLQTEGYQIKGVQKILREGGVEDVKRLGKVEVASREQRERGAARASAAAVVDTPRQLSAMQVSALRAVMTELEAVRAILAGASADAGTQRQRRTAARG